MGMADYSYHSLANMGPQGRWRRVLFVAMIPMAFALIYYSYPHSYMPSKFTSSQYGSRATVCAPADMAIDIHILKMLHSTQTTLRCLP
jgi:hypothetical protein